MSVKDLTEQMLDSLLKKEAPVVSRVRRKFLKETGFGALKRKIMSQKNKEQISEENAEKTEANFGQPLAKNEYEVNVFDNGDLKMDFGPDVPELVKKRAVEWAKRRGLRVKEASLGKNYNGFEWIIIGK